MARTAQQIALRLVYQGGPPVHWSGDESGFGVQDKDNRLIAASRRDDGAVVFDFSLTVRDGGAKRPDLSGPFAHGPRAQRFVYLSWRNANGAYAQRFKLPLGIITAEQIDNALATGRPITGVLVIAAQRATTTGANIGGTRPVEWV